MIARRGMCDDSNGKNNKYKSEDKSEWSRRKMVISNDYGKPEGGWGCEPV